MVGQFAQAWDRIVQRAPLAPCAVAFSLGIFLGEWTTLPVWAGLVPALFFLGLIWRLPGWRVGEPMRCRLVPMALPASLPKRLCLVGWKGLWLMDLGFWIRHWVWLEMNDGPKVQSGLNL